MSEMHPPLLSQCNIYMLLFAYKPTSPCYNDKNDHRMAITDVRSTDLLNDVQQVLETMQGAGQR